MKPFLARQEQTGRSGVAANGWPHEFQRVATCTTTEARNGGAPHFSWDRDDRRSPATTSTCGTRILGPAFVKIGAYFLYPVKVWLNGHERAKRQASQAGIGWTALANGFAGCADSASSHEICDPLCPTQIQGFFDRRLARLPLPLTTADWALGYWWELSRRQVEMSPHHRVRPAPQLPGVLRSFGGRQPRPGPARTDRVDLRQKDSPDDTRGLCYPGRHPRR